GSTIVTTRHKRLASNILKYPTKREAMLKTGYSESYAEAGHILKSRGFKKAMKSVLEKLEKEEARILDELANKELGDIRYKDLVDSMDKIRKNIQLAQGRPTEIIGDEFSNLTNEQLRELTKQSKGRTSD